MKNAHSVMATLVFISFVPVENRYYATASVPWKARLVRSTGRPYCGTEEENTSLATGEKVGSIRRHAEER
jgi:hypothetical protein